MRVLAAVIEVATLAMFHPGQDLALRRAVALQLAGNDDAGNVREALEELAKKLLGGLLIAPALDQDVEDMIVLIPYSQNTRTRVPARGYTSSIALHFSLSSAPHSWILTGIEIEKTPGERAWTGNTC
jgi:hypothetical protein